MCCIGVLRTEYFYGVLQSSAAQTHIFPGCFDAAQIRVRYTIGWACGQSYLQITYPMRSYWPRNRPHPIWVVLCITRTCYVICILVENKV